jgi:hypothetical protein
MAEDTTIAECLVASGPKVNVLARTNAIVSASQTPDAKSPLSRLYDDRPSQRFIFPSNDVDDFVLVETPITVDGTFNTWVSGEPRNWNVTEEGTAVVAEETNVVNKVDGSSVRLSNTVVGQEASIDQDHPDCLAGETLGIDVYTKVLNSSYYIGIEIYNPVTKKYLAAGGNSWVAYKVNAFKYNNTSLARQQETFTMEDFDTIKAHSVTLQIRINVDDSTVVSSGYVDNFFLLPGVKLIGLHSHNIESGVPVWVTRSEKSLASTYPVDHAIYSNGSTGRLEINSEMNGSIDTDKFIFSTYIRHDGRDNSRRTLLRNDSERLMIDFDASNNLRVLAYSSTPTLLINRTTTATFTASTTWLHVLVAVDLSVPKIDIYVNDSSEANAGTLNSGTIDMTGGGWTIGATDTGTHPIEGALGPTFFYGGIYLDLSVEANRRLFRSSEGNWVDAGDEGRTPFGSQPHIWMYGNTPEEFAANKGGGGAFSVAGSTLSMETISTKMTMATPTFYEYLSAVEHERYWRVKFMGQQSANSGSVGLGQLTLTEPRALLRNPSQTDFQSMERMPNDFLENKLTGERWVRLLALAEQRVFRLRFGHRLAHQKLLADEIWRRSMHGAYPVIMVPNTRKDIIIHSYTERNEYRTRETSVDRTETELIMVENPHGILAA